MAENDKCWSSLSLPNLYSRNLQQKSTWDTFTVAHLLLSSMRCSWTLTPCRVPQKGAVMPTGATFSSPGSSLVPSLKINWWRGCLRSQGKSWDGKSHYKVLPEDKVRFRLSHLKQKAAQRSHIYVLWKILLKAHMDVHVLWLQDTQVHSALTSGNFWVCVRVLQQI